MSISMEFPSVAGECPEFFLLTSPFGTISDGCIVSLSECTSRMHTSTVLWSFVGFSTKFSFPAGFLDLS